MKNKEVIIIGIMIVFFAVIFAAIVILRVGSPLEFGDKWKKLRIVRNYRFLE